MKKIILNTAGAAAAAAVALLLPAIALGATLSFDRTLAAGGIAIVSSSCPAATSGGHMVYDIEQFGTTTRLNTVGNIVAFDGSFSSYIKIPDGASSGAAIIRAICPDGSVISSAVVLGPFTESVPLPGTVPSGGVDAGGGGASGNFDGNNAIPALLFFAGAVGLGALAVRQYKYNS